MRHDPWGGLPPAHPIYCTCVDCVRRRLRRPGRWAWAARWRRGLRRFPGAAGRLLRRSLGFPAGD